MTIIIVSPHPMTIERLHFNAPCGKLLRRGQSFMQGPPMSKRLPKTFNCPTEFTLAVLGGKWKTVILCYLKQQPWRYSDLRRLVPELSDKMLTERLRDLIAMGLVVHHKQGPGRKATGYYALTPKGRSLGSLLNQIYSWGDQHAKLFDVELGYPLKKLQNHKSAIKERPKLTVHG
jgi:DNA-binding HxlR family transcriptional regulator